MTEVPPEDTSTPSTAAAASETPSPESKTSASTEPPSSDGPKTPAAAGRPKNFRPEIHGLRGLAIVLVVVYHLWGSGRVSGGVDVFLMISAYLMVGSFARRGTSFKLWGFLVNRFRRLVPQAILVIIAVVAAGYYFVPPARWQAVLEEAQASVLYYENWHLISLAANYYDQNHGAASPLQHYWSMSVQGQIFVVWPLLMVLAIGIHKLTRANIRVILGTIFALITAASFTYAVVQVNNEPVAAYFHTLARAWEFALPSLLAVLPAFRFPRPLAIAMGWLGVLSVCFAGLIVGGFPFPSWAALLPLLAASIVVLAGSPGGRLSADWWLSRSIMSAIADRAYAIYLWHWPVMVYYLTAIGEESVGLLGGLLVMAISGVLADLSTRLIDRGLLRWKPISLKRFAVPMMAIFIILGLATVQGGHLLVQRMDQKAATADPLGAAAVEPGQVAIQPESADDIYPPATRISEDIEATPLPCPADMNPKPWVTQLCAEYMPDVEPTKTVAIVGDSHSYQWQTPLLAMAKDHNWRLVSVTWPACRLTPPGEAANDECEQYSARATDWVLRNRPDVVVSVGTHTSAVGPEVLDPTYIPGMQPFVDAGIQVVTIRDNPRFPFSVAECIQTEGPSGERCNPPIDQKLSSEPFMEQIGSTPGFEATIDMTDYLCPGGVCSGAIGNVYVYHDDNHLSRTYATSLRPFFEERWNAALAR